MKFIKMCQYDLKQGILNNKGLLLCPILFALLLFFDTHRRVMQLTPLLENPSQATYGDYWFSAYGGMKEYIPSPENPFQFPASWLLLFLLVSFMLLQYPTKDIQHLGPQVLIQSKKRLNWWLAKCVWIILGTVLYHVLFLLCLALLCSLFQIPINLKIHTNLLELLFKFDMTKGLYARKELSISVFLLPIVISMMINLFQMCLTFFIKPVFSFLAVAIMMLSSAYLLSPWMVGNFAMPLRYSWISEGGVNDYFGWGVVGILSVVISIVGGIRFKKYDILNKE